MDIIGLLLSMLVLKELDRNGMVIDFTIIKEKIHGRLDHRHINDVLGRYQSYG